MPCNTHPLLGVGHYAEWTLVSPCRLAAYGRASDSIRALPATDASQPLQALLTYCKELAVSYTGLLLTMDMFPQVGALCFAPAVHQQHFDLHSHGSLNIALSWDAHAVQHAQGH